MPPKKPSGAEFKKLRKEREEKERPLGINLRNWLSTSTSSDHRSSDQINFENIPSSSTSSTVITFNQNITSFITDNSETEPELLEPISNSHIDFSDPAKWPLVNDKTRVAIVEYGFNHNYYNDLSNYIFPEDNDGRHFSSKWLYKSLPNGEKIRRKWLVYSCSTDKIFCYPCVLFSKCRVSAFTDTTNGYCDWKHLNPNISVHENTNAHLQCYIEWIELENRIKKGKTIDDDFQKVIKVEKQKWRDILKVVIDVILYCARNNLALRGKSGIIGENNCGIFLNTIELISHYHPLLAEHISTVKSKKGSISYFSPKIQNEVINLMGEKVRNEIISKIKDAKYFSIIFDCTPDLSHKEQMSQIIRYLEVIDNQCCIKESFIDFIVSKEKTGHGLATEIMNKIQSDGLNIENCRGQGFDNGANMAGQYNGVQSKLIQINEWARFIPCAAHSLNLVGLHATETSPCMITFFGTVQRIFTFFSGSTTRWDKLLTVIKITLKAHCETRWSSKKHAVSALFKNIKDIYIVLQNISNDPSCNNDTVSGATVLLKQITFKFLCLLHIWNDILSSIDKINCSLQSKNISIDTAYKIIKGLVNIIKNLRNSGIASYVEVAKHIAVELDLETDFPEKRKTKKKRMVSELAEDEGHSINSKREFEREFNAVMDSIIVQMEWRYKKMEEVSSDFEFLSGHFLYHQSDDIIKKYASDLAIKYSKDLDGTELVSELLCFKHQASSLFSDLNSASPLDLINVIHSNSLKDIYPNIEIALRIFLTLPVTVASCERSFSKLKIIKNYLRSTLGQERLTNLGILSIEFETSNSISYEDIIDDFAATKARKIKF
ncbi:zinc finger MYM-type protein 1-like [Myzus persicae]|uniref:zinc finger MYM-type protein 1-like n=1 Tax=Myzus persicae TaxID=13164 RepID=UPI000B9305F2|nr:zinc finger MYM-type protein 1-like [Myzus persicae]